MEESLPVIQFTHRTTGEVRVGHFHPPSTKLPSEWTDGYGERVEAPEDITDWLAGGAGSGGGGGGGGDIQDLLDGISTTRGSLLYRDSADWEDLAPGIEGAPLVSGGAGANPVWGLGVENVIKTCKNDTGTNITKGTPVKVTGVHGELPKIEVATASNTHVPSGSGSNEIFGIAATTINHNAAGPVLIQGTLTGLNTSAYSSGNLLYVPTSGTTLTATPPAVPYDRICIALVTKVDATDGQICVRTPQPIHLNDITGFDIGTLADWETIRYEQANNKFIKAPLIHSASTPTWTGVHTFNAAPDFASGVKSTVRTNLQVPGTVTTGITGATAVANIVIISATDYANLPTPRDPNTVFITT